MFSRTRVERVLRVSGKSSVICSWFDGDYATAHIGKIRTRHLLSSTTINAPEAKSASCCLRAAITTAPKWSGNCHRHFPFLDPLRGIGQRLVNVFGFQVRVGVEDLFA